MAILAQYGVLKCRESKTYRQWENSENKEIHIVFTEINASDKVVFPSVQIIVDGITTAATLYLCDNDTDTEIESFAMTVGLETGYTQLIKTSAATTISTYGEGYYYLKIVHGDDTYYFDVFRCKDDVSGQLGITVTSSDFAMGKNKAYTFNMTGLTFLAYFNVWEKPYPFFEEDEEAEDTDGIVSPYYWSAAKVLSWVIDGTEPIFDFLGRLRGMLGNGTISIIWHEDTYTVNDIEASVDESFNDGDLLNILIKIKPSNEVMTVINSI